MKSRISSYNKTLLFKNVTRFMPFWGLYTLCLLLGFAMLVGPGDKFYYFLNLGECARTMAIVNCVYALVVAQLLFGDLYDSRMCNGLHSLPMRREEIFWVNVLSGILFSLVPAAVMTLFALPMSLGNAVVRGWQIPLLWFAATNLQYLFFFGLAVFCVFCAGNRFSMAVIYGILNLGGVLLNLLVSTLYLPMMPGVVNNETPYLFFCPVIRIADTPLLMLRRDQPTLPGTFTIQSSWGYLFGCAAIGIGLMILAMIMYRKRALECAGEFIVIRALKPVFLVIFSLVAATGLDLVVRVLFGFRERNGLALGFAFAGLIIGWFVGLMLMEKSVRVFHKKTLLGGGILIAVMACSLIMTKADLLGITSWVPKAEKVEYVAAYPSYDSFGRYWTEQERYQQRDPEAIEKAIQMHRLAIAEGLTEEDTYSYYQARSQFEQSVEEEGEHRRVTSDFSIEYHMKDGSVCRRYYTIYADGEAGKLAREYFSLAPNAVEGYEHLALRIPARFICVDGISVPDKYLTREDTTELLEAIAKDCEEGTMAQKYEFHPVPVYERENGDCTIPCLDLYVDLSSNRFIQMNVFSDSAHTFKWLRARGMVTKVIDKLEESYR